MYVPRFAFFNSAAGVTSGSAIGEPRPREAHAMRRNEFSEDIVYSARWLVVTLRSLRALANFCLVLLNIYMHAGALQSRCTISLWTEQFRSSIEFHP